MLGQEPGFVQQVQDVAAGFDHGHVLVGVVAAPEQFAVVDVAGVVDPGFDVDPHVGSGSARVAAVGCVE